MAVRNLEHLPTFDEDEANVIIETPKGQRVKFKYDGERDLFRCEKILPFGLAFPFDFGFLPSTIGGDGDPLDVLVLSTEPGITGSVVLGKLVAIQEGEQTEKGKTNRNDRLIAIPVDAKCREAFEPKVHFSDELDKALVEFFVTYNKLQGKEFKPLGTFGAQRALEIVKEGMARAKRKGNDKKNHKKK